MTLKSNIFCLFVTFLTSFQLSASPAIVEEKSALDSQLEDLIVNNVHPEFQQTARQLIHNPRVFRVSADQGLTVELRTADLTLEAEVQSPGIQFTIRQPLQKLTKIPFPRKEKDLSTCYGNQLCPTGEFLNRLKSQGFGVEGRDTLTGKNYHLDFMQLTKRTSTGNDVKVYTRVILQENQNSFDENEPIGFGNNTCDESVCVGSVYTKIRLIKK